MQETAIEVNGRPRRVPSGCSVADLVSLLALPGERVAVERNGEVVPRRQWAEVSLADGDRLEVVTFVGGG